VILLARIRELRRQDRANQALNVLMTGVEAFGVGTGEFAVNPNVRGLPRSISVIKMSVRSDVLFWSDMGWGGGP
jgi:hypothetical protein